MALARALITDPAILVLDDATSAIDARVEAQIHGTLRRVMAGRTTLLIAHRRSTLQLADQIAVLDEGRLVDLGTHEELTERCSLYRLLLSGPGDDAEGVDAGELSTYQHEAAQTAAACRTRPAPGQITPSLWPDRADEAGDRASSTVASAQLAAAAAAGIGRGSLSAGLGGARAGRGGSRGGRRHRGRLAGRHTGVARAAGQGRRAAAGRRHPGRGPVLRPGAATPTSRCAGCCGRSPSR